MSLLDPIPFRCSVKPTSTMVELLTLIWQRVLRHSPINVEDNFFELGGDSSLALELFNEIARECGRELPAVMIYHAPTVGGLAAVLEQPTPPRVPPVVQLRAGTEEPPVFITHGLGGSVMDFFQVVRHMQTARPIYGMQTKGVDGVDEPFEQIEDMAQSYLDAIKEVQPQGPYLLIGYSLGGLVTLEIAQRLSKDGEKVALLAMLDAYPHISYLSTGQRLRLAMRQLKRRTSALMQSSIAADGRPIISSDRYRPPNGVLLSPTMQRVRDRAYVALTRYRPRFYSGKIRFVKAELSSDFPDDPAAIWAKLANEFEVDAVPGDHLGIMTTHYASLASVLSRYLKEALCQK